MGKLTRDFLGGAFVLRRVCRTTDRGETFASVLAEDFEMVQSNL